MGAQPTNEVQLTHARLCELLLPVLPHADQPNGWSSLPVLEHVHLQTRGGFLTATATDRYTIAIARVPTSPEAQVNALLHHREVKALLAMFKPRRGKGQVDMPLTLTFGEDELQVEGAGALFSNALISYSLGHADFPAVRFIFEERLGTKSDGEPFALNPQLLAKFAVASKVLDGAPLRVETTHQARPTIVTVGDSFMGAIMPVRSVGNDGPDAPNWTEFLAPAAVKGELAKAGK